MKNLLLTMGLVVLLTMLHQFQMELNSRVWLSLQEEKNSVYIEHLSGENYAESFGK